MFVYTDPCTGDVWIYAGVGGVWNNASEACRITGNELIMPGDAIKLERLADRVFTEDKPMNSIHGFGIESAAGAAPSCDLSEALKDNYFKQTAARLLAAIMTGRGTAVGADDWDRAVLSAVAGAKKLVEVVGK